MSDTQRMIRDLLCIRLRASASLSAQLGTAAQEPLRKHFLDNAILLLEAADAIDPSKASKS